MDRASVGKVLSDECSGSNIGDFLRDSISQLKLFFFDKLYFVSIQNKAMSSDDTEKTDDNTERKERICEKDIIQLLPLIFLWIFIILPQLIKGDDDDE